MAHATLITAFYPIRSKFPPAQYMRWAAEFLRLKAPIVLYTTPELAQTFADLRGKDAPLRIIPRPFEELTAWSQYSQQWRLHHEFDRERSIHTPELYAVWASKAFLVSETVAANPFNTTHFFWCDIGAFRSSLTPSHILETFPATQHFPQSADRILLCSVAPLAFPTDLERRPDGIVGDFGTRDRIVGGLWGGTGEACQRWKSAFEAQLIRYFAAGRFAGKDQSVMLSAVLEDPEIATVVEPPPQTLYADRWFYLQRALATPSAPIRTDPSYLVAAEHSPTTSIHMTVMGGLANQIFQVVAAYAHARRTGSKLCIRASKEREDGRPLYWRTVLHRFQHFLERGATATATWWEPAATVHASPPAPTPQCPAIRLAGYFQSSKYFTDSPQIAAEIRLLLAPEQTVLRAIKTTYADLLEAADRVVVVHARRTDYLKHADHHGPLTAAYYQAATEAVAARIPDPLFLLVSDDPLYWMEIMAEVPVFQRSSFHILMENNEITTLTLLQQFNWFILANSTFSWWAAWLSAAPADQIYAPARWFGPAGPKDYEDIYEAGWNRIDQA